MGWARWYLNSMLVGLLLICLALIIYRWSILARRIPYPAEVLPSVASSEAASTNQGSSPAKNGSYVPPDSTTEPRQDHSEKPKPSQGQQQAKQNPIDAQHPLDVNSASVGELDELPGIGAVLAQRIIDYRRASGPFKKVADLLNVEGIGPAKLAAIEKLIYVKPIH